MHRIYKLFKNHFLNFPLPSPLQTVTLLGNIEGTLILMEVITLNAVILD